MFTGDLVVLGGSVMIDASHGGDLAEYLRRSQRMLALHPCGCCRRTAPRSPSPAPLLRGYIDHRRLREQQVVDGARGGPRHGAVDRRIHL